MKLMLIAGAVLALAAASIASGTSSSARIWLVSPTTVAGSGFPAGKVTVTANGVSKATKTVTATATGRFTARFERPVPQSRPCRYTVITAVGANGVRASTKLAGKSTGCPPPIEP
jgi:hypothetical protein